MLKETVTSVLAFRVIPTTILTLITCISLLIALIVTDVLPEIPENQNGLNFKQAYEDLRQITAHPHPYNSHSNDDVRSYLLSRLLPIGDQYSHVHISDDLISNGSWAEFMSAVYFEGTNILVKIDGTSTTSTSGGVLFSAHYDSVPTSPGSTDNGMAVVTLLQLVQYFAKNRPLRTAVFNINNGEEDWLNGAHAYLEHPWSGLTDTFLNLEGAAAGGRPILFRASSVDPVRSFRSKHVPHPHANVLSTDAFARGFIRSETDYEIYVAPRSSVPGSDNAPLRPGMQGLDVAFYKGRSRYHTKYDTVPYTSGGERSLWSMMEVVHGVGIELLNQNDLEEHQRKVRAQETPVYFDMFKLIVFVFPITNMLAFNIVVLILGPIILVSLAGWKHINSARQRENGSLQSSFRRDHHDNVTPVYHLHRGPKIQLLVALWTHSKFWIAVVVTLGLAALLIFLYTLINPFAVYSSPYIVLLSFLSLTYLSLTFVLTLPTSLPFYSSSTESAQEDKQVTFLHLYLFTWILLVLATFGITCLEPGIGGGYLMSAWNVCVGLGCMIAGVAGVAGGVAGGHDRTRQEIVDETYEELEGENINVEEGEGEDQHLLSEPDESTPLIQEHPRSSSIPQPPRKEKAETETLAETWWWIPQFIVSVPLPIILFSQITMLLLDAMSQTLADGSPAVTVYGLAALLSLILVLPLSPYMKKLQRSHALSLFILSLFVLSILYTWTTFPFSSEAPLKVSFQQRVEIDLPHLSNNGDNTRTSHKMISSLSGHPRYLPNSAIISNLPSAQTVNCKSNFGQVGLTTCEWESGPGMLPFPGKWSGWNDDEAIEYFNASVSRTGSSSARISIKGVNTRSCRVYFDNQPIQEFTILHDEKKQKDKGMQPGYEIGKEGIQQLMLWSRTWEKEFVVDVKWDFGRRSGLQGRVGCEWAEYESGRVDHGSGSPGEGKEEETFKGGKIPAFEEVLRFLPEWAVALNKPDVGLVRVFTPFSI